MLWEGVEGPGHTADPSAALGMTKGGSGCRLQMRDRGCLAGVWFRSVADTGAVMGRRGAARAHCRSLGCARDDKGGSGCRLQMRDRGCPAGVGSARWPIQELLWEGVERPGHTADPSAALGMTKGGGGCCLQRRDTGLRGWGWFRSRADTGAVMGRRGGARAHCRSLGGARDDKGGGCWSRRLALQAGGGGGFGVVSWKRFMSTPAVRPSGS